MFAKVFAQIFDSSISEDYMVRHIFMDLLVLADQEGIVDMTITAISRRTNVPPEIISRAIERLMENDSTSRSDAEEGRRLGRLDSHRNWGWYIVNWDKYRNMRDEEARKSYFREYQRKRRAEQRAVKDRVLTGVDKSDKVELLNDVTHTEAEADTEKDKNKASRVVFELPEWISKDSWEGFLEVRRKKHSPNTERALKGIVGELEKLRACGTDPNASLDQSTMRGWSGVFETTRNGNGKHNPLEKVKFTTLADLVNQ